jgi:hypothetical protein
MNRKTLSLDVIDVARPCEMDGNEMRGDDRVRFCSHCSLHVYNLSEMDSDKALRLVRETEGRLCVRFYRRADGTVVTRDCGIKAAKRLGRWASGATAVVLSSLVAALGFNRSGQASATLKCDRPVVTDPVAGNAVMGDAVMGKIRPPTSQPSIKMGEVQPLMGSVAPLLPPPATQPATQPAAITSK